MTPANRHRRQLPPSVKACALLEAIPDEFNDDGCSSSPDRMWWFGWWWFRWACRIHDWRYCGRCHPPGTMNQAARRRGDIELGGFIRQSVPTWAWPVASLYRLAVRRHGGRSAWNSCGPTAENAAGLCRHGIGQPQWMRALDAAPEETA
jgi:hypothetical protein